MDTLTILAIIFILAIDVVIFIIDRKNKVIFHGRNKYGIIVLLIVVIFAIISNNFSFKLQDVILLIALSPLVVIGNRNGITEKGILLNSYVTTWDKIEYCSLKEEISRYVLSYKTIKGTRNIYLKKENIEDVKKHLLTIKKLKYNRK